MSRKIVMMSGFIASGKDTCSDFLVSMKGYIKFSFADALKEFTANKYGFLKSLCYTQAGKKMPYTYPNGEVVTIRDLLIKEGGEQRALNENVWIEYVINSILKETPEDAKIVISDFRYPNEYLQIKKQFDDTTAVRITREDAGITDIDSEHLLDNFSFDKYISNEGSYEELYYGLQYLYGF
jgi:hypothetical protein